MCAAPQRTIQLNSSVVPVPGRLGLVCSALWALATRKYLGCMYDWTCRGLLVAPACSTSVGM